MVSSPFLSDLAPEFFTTVRPGRGAKTLIVESLRSAIDSGQIDSGTPLPSSRSLAAHLGVARSTVVNAYTDLAADGWIATRHGSKAIATAQGRRRDETEPQELSESTEMPRWDLRPGRAEIGSFPAHAWMRAMRTALADAPKDVLDFGDPRGIIELRVQIARYLGRKRKLQVDPANVVIFAGGRQSVSIMMRSLRVLGSTAVGLEDPGNPLFPSLASGVGLEICDAPVDDRGVCPDPWLAHRGPLLGVFLTPSHQAPLGSTLSAERRRLLVTWARDTGAFLFEEDHGTEFRSGQANVPALQPQAPECVVYGWTTSRSLAPGLRLSWLVVPPRLLDIVVEQRQLAGGQCPELDQLTLAQLLASGAYDRHVHKMRLRYHRRALMLGRALSEGAPHVEVSGMHGGAHALVDLPPSGPSEQQILAAGRSQGLITHGLTADGYSTRLSASRQALIVGFTTPPEHAYPGALRALVSAIQLR